MTECIPVRNIEWKPDQKFLRYLERFFGSRCFNSGGNSIRNFSISQSSEFREQLAHNAVDVKMVGHFF